ncbi:uncharacterized protein LOC132193230 isoform X2 [Neocloeon triangulifer]|uniref:uncharacterized protein LOC132193230 isoform X2 n=1 Tax=Neocloeon triangulifer TaxID=2078957 RepID=UPI00286F463C|nr:uncharacterized protein LOC132193230 isoform X2 [Neocloeon triangulifer]
MTDKLKRFFYFPEDISKHARTWVLVIHHEFKGFEDQRFGNDKDVINLRSAFTRRNCNFKDLASKSKAEILQTLSDQQKLVALFNENVEENEPPDLFILFILSHGTSNGVIETDHLVPRCDPEQPEFESYNRQDVWNGLKGMEVLKNCTKLLFMGPCRGKNLELPLPAPAHIEAAYRKDKTEPIWISTEPNWEDTIVFYSAVETTKAQRNSEGTWLVIELCNELNSMREDLDLFRFLTRVQKRISEQRTFETDSFSQTPQLQIFTHRRITIYSNPLVEGADGKSSTSQVTNQTDFYLWRAESFLLFRRGRALIFHDEKHAPWSPEARKSFQHLDFETKTYGLNQLLSVLENVSTFPGYELQEEGCFAVCLMAKLVNTKEDGLLIFSDKVKVSVNKLIQPFTGLNCPGLTGKPKLFFFLDKGGKDDSKSEGEVSKDWISKGNNHGEIFTFVGIAEPESQHDIVTSLLSQLKKPALKNGLSLQEAVINVMRKCSSDGDTFQILPQITSTLKNLLDFPPCKNMYIKPSFVMEGCTEPKTFDDLIQDFAETAKNPEEKSMNRTWVASADAGCGNSTATEKIARQLHDLLPEYLIINISLITMREYFLEEMKAGKDHAAHHDFLKRALAEREYDLNRLEEKLSSKQIVVLLDGFDEVWACADFVLETLRDINAANLCLWITTRPHELPKILRKIRDPIKLEINPMTKDEQLQLLKTVLNKNDGHCKQLLDKVKAVQDETATPLHLKMIAEIEGKKVYIEGSIFSLYYQFVFSKVEPAIRKHYGTKESDSEFTNFVHKNIELLMKVAVNYFYRENLPCPQFLISHRSKQIIDQMGIASVSFEGRKLKSINFKHQTYAECLLSLLFLSKAGHFTKENKCYFENIDKINLNSLLLKKEFTQVRSFIDSFYISSDFQLKMEITNIEECCEKSELQSQAVTLMSLICKEGLLRLFTLFFESKLKEIFGDIVELVNTPFKEDTYQYYPLHSACFSSEEIALRLLEMGAKIENLHPDKCQIEDGQNILHLAAKNGFDKLIPKILEVLPELKSAQDNKGKTPADAATAQGHFKCVNILLD